ncbi:MAG: DUF488 family protein [Acidimicrobiia bacterium]
MTLQRLYTIGVYGFTADSFVSALRSARVDVLVDVRQRRGVRGSRHSFANAAKLDAMLGDVGIASLQWKDLAPSTELRQLQKSADSAVGTTKSVRAELASEFVDGYRQEVLSSVDPDELLERLDGYERPAFLCVERAAMACHRGLLARFLAEASGLEVVDLEP